MLNVETQWWTRSCWEVRSWLFAVAALPARAVKRAFAAGAKCSGGRAVAGKRAPRTGVAAQGHVPADSVSNITLVLLTACFVIKQTCSDCDQADLQK